MASVIATTSVFLHSSVGSTGNANTHGLTLAADDYIVAVFAMFNNTLNAINVSSMTQTNMSWAQASTQAGGTSTRCRVSIWYAKVGSSPGSTITPNFAGASGNNAAVHYIQVRGLATSSVADQTGGNTDSDGSQTVTASGANTTAGGIAFAVSQSDDSGETTASYTTPSGYTQIGVNNDGSASIFCPWEMARKIYSSSETSSASWTFDNVGAQPTLATIATFKDASTDIGRKVGRWSFIGGKIGR